MFFGQSFLTSNGAQKLSNSWSESSQLFLFCNSLIKIFVDYNWRHRSLQKVIVVNKNLIS